MSLMVDFTHFGAHDYAVLRWTSSRSPALAIEASQPLDDERRAQVRIALAALLDALHRPTICAELCTGPSDGGSPDPHAGPETPALVNVDGRLAGFR